MSTTITGTIKHIGQTQVISDRFSKREIVLTTADQYPQHILLQAVNQRCSALDSLSVGQTVTAHINIRGREYTRPDGTLAYFNTLEVWKIEQQQSAPTYTPPPSQPMVTDEDPF